MSSSLIQTMYEDFKKKGQYTIPAELLPPENGYCLIRWVRELFLYYADAGIIARALDDLPPIRLSTHPGLPISLQNIHKFIIGEQNLIPLEIKRTVVEAAIQDCSSQAALEKTIQVLLPRLNVQDRATVQDEVSWKFSPVGEALWVVLWFFMEREVIQPPPGTRLVCHRFPYYVWVIEGEENTLQQQSLWEPDNALCRWEWLACDLFYNWMRTHQGA